VILAQVPLEHLNHYVEVGFDVADVAAKIRIRCLQLLARLP